MTIYLPPNRSLQDYMIYLHEQDELGLYVSRTQCLTKESRSLLPMFHGSVLLSNILYTVRCTKKVLWSYESVGPSVRAKHKIGQYDLYFMVQ